MKNEKVVRIFFCVLLFFLGRIAIVGFHSVGVAGFVAFYGMKKTQVAKNGYVTSYRYLRPERRKETGWQLLSVLAGIATVSSLWSCLRYGLALLMIWILFEWMNIRENQRIKRSTIASLVLFFVSVGMLVWPGRVFWMPQGLQVSTQVVISAFLIEGLFLAALVVIFQRGAEFILGIEQHTEALFGMVFLLAISAQGATLLETEWFRMSLTVGLFLLLVMGHRFGSIVGSCFGLCYGGLHGLFQVLQGSMLSDLVGQTMEVELSARQFSDFAAGVSSAYGGGGAALQLQDWQPFLAGMGLYALCGLLSGLVRRVSFVASALLVFGTGMFYELVLRNETRIYVLIALVWATVLFFLLPSRYKCYDRIKEETAFHGTLSRDRMSLRLHEMAGAFHGIARAYETVLELRELEGESKESALDSQAGGQEGVVEECTWNGQPVGLEDKSKKNILGCIPEELEEVSIVEPCLAGRKDDFLDPKDELRRVEQFWKGRVAQNRQAVGEHMGEIARIMTDFEEELSKEHEILFEEKECLRKALARMRIELLDVVVFAGERQQRQVYLRVRCQSGQVTTARQLVSVVSQIFGQAFRLKDENKMILTRRDQTVSFVEEVHYKVITGISRCVKNGEVISGDNFSALATEQGKVLLSISDGMGSGSLANEQSQCVLDLLDQLLEAGFDVMAAVRLLNSMLLFQGEKERFSTLDICLVDLYTGICQFVKSGGAASYIRRERIVEKVSSASLPMGIWDKIEIDTISKKLYDGDMLVMVSDGILEQIQRNQFGEQQDQTAATLDEEFCGVDTLMKQLSEWKTQNPQELADLIMDFAKPVDEVRDDMTVMVAGIWNR